MRDMPSRLRRFREEFPSASPSACHCQARLRPGASSHSRCRPIMLCSALHSAVTGSSTTPAAASEISTSAQHLGHFRRLVEQSPPFKHRDKLVRGCGAQGTIAEPESSQALPRSSIRRGNLGVAQLVNVATTVGTKYGADMRLASSYTPKKCTGSQ
jgi:hypothetical protein